MNDVVHSAVYFGAVRHRRRDGVRHAFRVPACFLYLDVDEIERAFAGRWWWSTRRFAPMRFVRSDYFGSPDRPLGDAVRDAVAARIGVRPDGAVRVLTTLRTFGYSFNPVSFYWCFDREERVVAVLAEITNIPWRERHHYVVAAPRDRGALRARFAKAFHVSPFQPMEQDYAWAFSPPGERLAVHMQNAANGRTVFDATFVARRRPWSTGSLLRAAVRHPLAAIAIAARIHVEALRLWWKGAPFHVHPKKRPSRA